MSIDQLVTIHCCHSSIGLVGGSLSVNVVHPLGWPGGSPSIVIICLLGWQGGHIVVVVWVCTGGWGQSKGAALLM